MEGISLVQDDEVFIMHVTNFSDELKESLRNKLIGICHGSDKSNSSRLMYSYSQTLNEFLARYDKKPLKTKIGMIGELLSHIIIIELLDDFEPVSAYFNLEERSIKKGFDVLLYSRNGDVWITEVKSGGLHKDKNSTQTTIDLLGTGFRDLNSRLNENNMNHWMNALHSANVSISSNKDYKKVVIEILEDEGDLTALKQSTSKDNNIVLVSALFSEAKDNINKLKIKEFSERLCRKNIFKSSSVICLKKSAYTEIEKFLREEAINA
jgi:hypothetical protein